MRLAQQLAEFTVETRLEDVPARTIAFSKFLLAKIAASMVKGAGTVSGRKATRFVTAQGTLETSTTLIGSGLRSSAADATFANGYFAHAAELEDDQFPSSTSDITVVPVVFSMIERYGLSGRNVLESAILGQEVMNRIGTYPLAGKGFVELPYYGVLGACIAAGKALQLERDQLLGALGIAMGRAGGLVTNFGTDAHYVESALACRDGLLAALLAKSGMAGNPDLETWLGNLLGKGGFDPDRIAGKLGKEWRIHTVWIKKYPCCFITHRPIDLLMKMLAQKQFQPDQVVGMTIEDNPIARICDRPTPVHTDDARFSFQQAISAALLDGDVDNHHFDPAAIDDPRFVGARKKVKIVLHDEWPRAFLAGPCRLTVELKDGRKVTGEGETAGGAPDAPLSEDEVHRLFTKVLRTVMPEQDIASVWDTIASLESQTDLRPLLAKLRSTAAMKA
jgi:2-methylcitrate dehydratase PrpD